MNESLSHLSLFFAIFSVFIDRIYLAFLKLKASKKDQGLQKKALL
jgi:hypothetical protein